LKALGPARDGRELRARVNGQLTSNPMPSIVRAAAAGFGPDCVLDDQNEALIAEGRLFRVLED
jgi:hypothetical protein